MTAAEAVQPEPTAKRRPIDPASDRGRAASAALAQIFAGVELRKARRDSKASTASTP